MSFAGPSLASGGKTVRRAIEFGRTYVVKPKGKHLATVVWLHGLGDNGSSWSQLLETLPLPNIKWICPTAPTQPITVFGGFPSTAWFDVGDLSEDAPDDIEGLDAAAAHVANLLSTEPIDIRLGIGGFSMGAATAMYSATCFAARKYSDGSAYPANLSAIVGLSGWLPCSKTLSKKIGVDEAARRAASLPILLCHGKGLVTTRSPKRWMRFVLGLLLNWGLEGVLHDSTLCAYMKDLLGREKTEAENIQRQAQTN